MWLVTEGPGVSLAHVYQSLRRCPNVKPFALLEPGLWGLVSTFPCERRRASETAPPSPGPPGALAPSLLGAPSSLLSTPPFRGCRPLGGGRCVHRLRVLLSLAHVCLQARWLLCVLQCPLPESAVNRKARPSHPRRPRKVPPRPAAMPEVERKPKITASRKLLLKSLMLAKAKECWEQELEDREAEKKCYLAERIPALQTRGLSLSALQVRVGAGLPTGPQDQLQELKLAGSKLRPLQVAPPLPGLHSPVWRGRAGVGRWVPFYRREGSLSREKGVAWGGAEQATGRVSDQRDGAERGAGQRLGGPVSPDLPVRPLQTGL
eukprot:XP_028339868.1 uncharacterized protein LOC114484878 isoform X1 [Physeter catodon]